MAQPERIVLPGDGLELVGEAYGDRGAPLVCFFHGGGQSRRSWSRAAVRIASCGYRCIAFDLRGHGESGWARDGDYRLESYGRDIEALLEAIAEPVALVGASRGGQAALVGGSRRPDLTRLIVLADVAPLIHDTGVEGIRAFFRASAAGFATIDEAAEVLSNHIGSPPRADLSSLARSMRREGDRLFWHWDPRTIAPEFIHAPTEAIVMTEAARQATMAILLVRAELSDVVSDASVRHFRSLTRQLRVETAAGVGHMLTGDQNDAFAARLLPYLESYLPTTAAQVAAARRLPAS